MLLLSVLLVSLLTATISYWVEILAAHFEVKLARSYNWLPVLAACLFLASWFIPEIHISKETTTFQQHFVGGGIYTACLYVYFKKLLGWKWSLFPSLIVLFAWVSAFGVANELIEFTLTKLNLAQIGTDDTDWDLLANTLGAFAAFGILLLFKVGRSNGK